MKKTTKLALFVGLVLLTCALMFTACDSGNKPQTPSGTNDITTTVEETTEHTCSFGEWMTIKEATCTETGEQEHVCACGTKETQSIDMIAHTEGMWITDKEATCSENGKKHQICAVCKTTIKTDEISATGVHTEVIDTAIAPTCTSNGTVDKVVYCSGCNKQISRETERSKKFICCKNAKSRFNYTGWRSYKR